MWVNGNVKLINILLLVAASQGAEIKAPSVTFNCHISDLFIIQKLIFVFS